MRASPLADKFSPDLWHLNVSLWYNKSRWSRRENEAWFSWENEAPFTNVNRNPLATCFSLPVFIDITMTLLKVLRISFELNMRRPQGWLIPKRASELVLAALCFLLFCSWGLCSGEWVSLSLQTVRSESRSVHLDRAACLSPSLVLCCH